MGFCLKRARRRFRGTPGYSTVTTVQHGNCSPNSSSHFVITCYSKMVCTSFFFTAVTGIAYLEQVQADHHLVNGAPLPPDGSIPLRRNVDVLEAESGPQWDLYVQALLEMQDVDAKDPLSYFQIAGSRLHPESSCLEVLHVLTKVVLGQVFTARRILNGTVLVRNRATAGSGIVLTG